MSQDSPELVEIPLVASDVPVPARIAELAAQGARRSKSIDCFGFVSSSCEMVYRVLDSLPRGTFCEWGSGLGVNTGIAASLGFVATGIELHPELAEASRALLRDYGLDATIMTGDYMQVDHIADLYYVYCWPGQMREVEGRFMVVAPATAKLLICHGAEDVRCKVKP
jgi:hypothetical protein